MGISLYWARFLLCSPPLVNRWPLEVFSCGIHKTSSQITLRPISHGLAPFSFGSSSFQ